MAGIGRHFGGLEAVSYIGSVWHPYKMLLIGETGSGKTSFLNLLCNSKLIEELGTKVDASKLYRIRHYNDLAIEDSTARAMASKTSEAKLYDTELCKMRMTVIDTPGLGDSRGLEQDRKNVAKIIDALRHEEYVNCVCLVINGRQARMSASLKYVLSEISTILPREIFVNIIVVFTYTTDPLDCNFDVSEMDHYFGRRIECAYYIENPYCRIEKAKQKAGQLPLEQIARSLKYSFENTAESLRSLQETIKDFKDVHTLHFIRLYDKKQEIERYIIIITASYDEQTKLEKEIKTAEEEVDAALKSQKLYTGFKSERKEFVDEAMKKKFEEAANMEQRANYLKQGLQKRREELLHKKNSLLQELNGKITEFQRLGISDQNYAKVLEKQCDVVQLRIEDSVGAQRAQLTALKDDLEKKLEVVTSALEQLPK